MQDLQYSLGKFYYAEHSHKPPTLLQVVGWTPNAASGLASRLNVYVRKIPIVVKQRIDGGEWSLDPAVFTEYDNITVPIHKGTHLTRSAILVHGGSAIRYNRQTIPIVMEKVY